MFRVYESRENIPDPNDVSDALITGVKDEVSDNLSGVNISPRKCILSKKTVCSDFKKRKVVDSQFLVFP